MPDTYTIFIIEKDFYGQGEAVYPIERINLATGKSFEDGEHILYVNGEYRGDSAIGKLMHDFNCTKADDMNFELMANRTRYLKENPKGVSEMCKIMEDMRIESLKEVALRMLAAGKYALEEISSISGLSQHNTFDCTLRFKIQTQRIIFSVFAFMECVKSNLFFVINHFWQKLFQNSCIFAKVSRNYQRIHNSGINTSKYICFQFQFIKK